jgi:hypothetical protein
MGLTRGGRTRTHAVAHIEAVFASQPDTYPRVSGDSVSGALLRLAVRMRSEYALSHNLTACSWYNSILRMQATSSSLKPWSSGRGPNRGLCPARNLTTWTVKPIGTLRTGPRRSHGTGNAHTVNGLRS